MRDARSRQEARQASFERSLSARYDLVRRMPVGVLIYRVWHTATLKGFECQSCGADCWCFIPTTWELPQPLSLQQRFAKRLLKNRLRP